MEEIKCCPKFSSQNYVKNGKVKGRQRYLCKHCGYRFTVAKLGKCIEKRIVVMALQLYLEGLGFRAIERVLGVSHVSVMNWVEEYGKDLDFVKTEGENKLGFAVGDRSEVTEDLLYQQIKNYPVTVYYTWKAYSCFLPADKHHQSKKETFTVENFNGLIRHYLARCKRKTKCYSKSLNMIIYSLNLLFYRKSHKCIPI